MKKNLMSVLIFALVLANLILTAILTFTIIPQTKKSNELIDQVCSAIHMDLESGQNGSNLEVPIENIEVYNIEDEFTINLKRQEGDEKERYAIFSVGISMDNKSEGYKKGKGAEMLEAKKTLIQDQINTIVQGFTRDEFDANSNSDVKNEILKALQAMFGEDFIVGISFSGVTTQ